MKTGLMRIRHKRWGSILLACFLLFILPLSLAACGEGLTEEQKHERQYEGYEIRTTCLTFTYGPTPEPYSNKKRVIALYPDGTATLTDSMVLDMSQLDVPPYPEGEAPIYKQHSFSIPVWTYAAFEEALFDNGFFTMDADLGSKIEKRYDEIGAEYNGKWYTVGASGWPQTMRPILVAYSQVLDNAYVDYGKSTAETLGYEYEDVTVTRAAMYWKSGVLHMYQTQLQGNGTRLHYTYADTGGFTQDDDPLSHLATMEQTTTIRDYFDRETFGELVELLEEIDFFSQPAYMTSGHPATISDDDPLYTQSYTVTIGDKSHTVIFPPEYYFFDLDWYGRLYQIFNTIGETSGDKPVTIETILEWD